MKLGWIRFGLEELKFLKSFSDLRIFCEKVLYLLPRATGTSDRYTKVPPSLQIEPTNHCNLDCTCCSASRSKRDKGCMDFDLFQRIIDDASQIGVNRVHLYLHGEPMLHPQIVEMIGYIKSKGLGVHLTTNGMPFNKQKIEAILHSGVNSADRIMFSVLGYSKEVHERIMKGVNHDKVMKNVYDFLELRQKYRVNGPVIETVFYTMPENENEKERFFEYWHGVVDHVHVINAVSKQFSELKTGVNSFIPIRNRTCSNLWERMTIFWNGDVTTCIADLDGIYRLGNLKEKSISEIWRCETLLSIKKLHKEKKFQHLPLCSRCDW